MKTLFLQSKYKDIVKLGEKTISKLPNSIALVTTVQYIDSINEIKQEIEATKRKVILLKGEHSFHNGQILGCDITTNSLKTTNKKFDAFFFIGDGVFHPKILLYSQKETEKKVFTYNPMTTEFREIKNSEIKNIERKYKAGILKFNTSKDIGIIVSTKPGQNRLKKATELKTKLKNSGKNAYIFLCSTLDFLELENFNFVDIYLNTMCPRIGYDDVTRTEKIIINYTDVEEFIK